MNKYKVTWESKQTGLVDNHWCSDGAYFKYKKDALAFQTKLLAQKSSVRNIQMTEV